MQTLTLIYSESFPIGKYVDALLRESIAPLPVARLDQLGPDAGALRIILVDPGISNTRPSSLGGGTAVVGIGLTEEPAWLSDDSVYVDLPADRRRRCHR